MVYGTGVVFFVGEKRLKDWLYRQIRGALDAKPALSSLPRFFRVFEKIAQCFLEAQVKAPESRPKTLPPPRREKFFMDVLV